jgi:hypothetical protein
MGEPVHPLLRGSDPCSVCACAAVALMCLIVMMLVLTLVGVPLNFGIE